MIQDVEVELGLDQRVNVEAQGILLEAIIGIIELVLVLGLVADLKFIVIGDIDESVLEEDISRSGLVGVSLNEFVSGGNGSNNSS